MELNQDVIAGKWKQLRGLLRQVRGHLNRDRTERITGQVEVQVVRLQERYGVAHARAKRALKRLGQQPRSWPPRRSA